MIYQVSVYDKISGKCHVKTVDSDNYPNAVKDAMLQLDKELDHPCHLIQNRTRANA